MLGAFANAIKIKELRTKLLITAGLLAISRIGVFVPLPGVDLAAVQKMMDSFQGGMGKVIQLANMFSGGGLRNASLFALGIMPYISASIIFQLLVAVVPSLQRISREGESGRRRINQYTRYATVGLCIVQAYMVVSGLLGGAGPEGSLVHKSISGSPFVFVTMSVIGITAGSLFLMWLGEQIDEFGIGSGISLLIMASIVSGLPAAVIGVAQRFNRNISQSGGQDIGPDKILLLLALFLGMVVAVVIVTQAQRRIPMNHARKTREGFTHRNYLPLRVNNAGVIAIIFAQSLMMVPSFFQMIQIGWLQKLIQFVTPWAFMYVLTYMLLILFFQYFYTALTFNPKEHAEQFKQYGAFIPGIRPGRKTADYLEYVMNRICLAGGVAMAVIAIAPQIISNILSVDQNTASFFGGTGLLIVVGVALDLVQRIESHMMMQHYDGFMGTGGRSRGRRM